jgi:DNA-binding NarL/FixJ family response regulator
VTESIRRARLLLADDHTLVVEGIRKLLESDFDLLGTVEDGFALLRAAEQLRPDVVLLDISMPRMNGIEACRQLIKLTPEVRVIFLTMHAEVAYVEESLRAGGVGYLLKRSAASELTGAIHTVMRGKTYVTPLIDWKLPRGAMDFSDREEPERLTPRQREVLQLVAEGRANKEIAALLHVSEKTVDFHKSAIKRELKLTSTAELTQFAIRHGIIGI